VAATRSERLEIQLPGSISFAAPAAPIRATQGVHVQHPIHADKRDQIEPPAAATGLKPSEWARRVLLSAMPGANAYWRSSWSKWCVSI
jgi:hypothetical protein